MDAELKTKEASLTVENIGGIDETEIRLEPGVTVLSGRNATNRTSLLSALMAALGSDDVSPKGDADVGHVDLTIDGETNTRTVRRVDGDVITEGDPYLEDSTLPDLFAFLLERNDARQAVARGDDLRDVIMSPIDTEEITRQIDETSSRIQQIDSELAEIDEFQSRLPDLESKRTRLQDDIEEAESELSTVQEEIAEKGNSVEEGLEHRSQLEEKLEELNDVRSERESVRRNIETEQDSIEALREERSALEDDLSDSPSASDERIEEIDETVSELRDQIGTLDASIDELQTVIQFNERLLEGDHELIGLLGRDDDGDVTDRLLDESDDVTCWTCGSEVDTGQIENTTEHLRTRRNEYVEERSEVKSDIEEYLEEQRELNERQREREEMVERLDRLENEIEERTERLADYEEREEALEAEIEDLEQEVEDHRTEDHAELIDLHKEANRLEIEIERLENERDEVTEEIERLEAEIATREDLESEREDLQDRLEDLRTRIDRLESNAVEQFNEHMETLLDLLEYENLERIWLERLEREGSRRRSDSERRFELHVVRATDDGTVYEDMVEHLSESERELTGLVFALAGYLVHDVHEEMPFMLIDSIEAIDSDRIAALVDYLREYPAYLVVALLEEDAAALTDDYHRVNDI